MKYFYIATIVIYLMVMIVWAFKYNVSNKMLNLNSEVIKTRSLTFEEYQAVGKATIIRHMIKTISVVSSIIMLALSAVLWYFNLFHPLRLVKAMVMVSAFRKRPHMI